MNKELIDKAWACLPREFKEKVKKEYARCVKIDADDNPNLPAYAVKSAISRRALLEKIFGEHNLTSDAEGDAKDRAKEPKPAEPKEDKHFDSILKDGFRDHNRLHIAAMAMQGILANSHQQIVDMKIDKVAELAIAAADKLIAECEKGGK